MLVWNRTLARVGPTHRSIEHTIGCVGRSDRSALRRLGTGVEPLLLKPRRDQPGDRVLPRCLERAGGPLVLREKPPDHRAARAVVLPRPLDDVEADRVAGLVIPLSLSRYVSRTHSNRMGAVRCGRPIGRPAPVSGRVVPVARGGFRRLGPPQHGTQGRVAQRLAQLAVVPEGFHDRGRVVLLPP